MVSMVEFVWRADGMWVVQGWHGCRWLRVYMVDEVGRESRCYGSGLGIRWEA